MNFETIKEKIPAAGNSSTLNSYAEVDAQPLDDISYYRLKQVDFDGKFTYSDYASVNNIKKSRIVEIYPNPIAGPELTVRYASAKDQMVVVSVYSSLGVRMVQEKQNVLKGLQSIQVDISHLSAGIYLVEVEDQSGEAHGQKQFIRSYK